MKSRFLLLRLGKPEVLTAAAIVTKANWPLFVPFNETARRPDGTPCGKQQFLTLMSIFNTWIEPEWSNSRKNTHSHRGHQVRHVLSFTFLFSFLVEYGSTV